MEMDKETKELLNQAIQMGVFQKHGSILTQIMNALGDEYEIDKQALKEAVETYRKMLKLEAKFGLLFPIVFVIVLPIFFLMATGRLEIDVWVWVPMMILISFITLGTVVTYWLYLSYKLNSNLAKVLKPKLGGSG